MKDKKVTFLILILVLAIGIIASGTFAYWQWITSTAQETLVNVSLTDDATIYIDFPENELTNMYPTSDCEANGTSSWITEITVNNGTGVLMATNFKLKIKIEDKDGNVITNSTNEWNTNPFRYYIKYAVTEENESCKNALITGRFDNNVLTYGNVVNTDPKYSQRNDWYDSKSITKDGSDGFPLVSSRIGSGVSFHALPNRETSHRYKVWVWLDEEYKSVTVGNDSTMDKLQDAKITVSWSENSELEQVKQTQTPEGEAIAIYSADDKSLRFYREKNPSSVTVGSTYNGRVVSAVYTDFESTGEHPWVGVTYDIGETMPNGKICDWDDIGFCELSVWIDEVVFVDYVYPVSTVEWFAGGNEVEVMDLTKLDTSNVSDMNSMFGHSTIDNIVGLENFNTSNVTNMSHMFFEMAVGNIIDLSGWNVCNVKFYSQFNHSFTGESGSEEENDSVITPYFGDKARCNGGNPAPNYDPRAGEAYAVYSEDDNSLRFYRSETSIEEGVFYNNLYVSNVYTGFESAAYEYDEVPWYSKKTDINTVVFEDYIYPVSTANWFDSMYNINYLDVNKLDTSNVTDMSSMFRYLYQGIYLDLTHFDTSNVTNMKDMFSDSYFELIGLENWNVSNVTNMENMFLGYNGYNGSNVDLSNWNVCNVTDFGNFVNNASKDYIVEPFFDDSLKCNGGLPA